jgi:putative hydroxymethylpyrimidine transport system substrate-binding protein
MRRPLRPSPLLLALALVPAALAGCAEKQDTLTPPAQRPVTVALAGPPTANDAGLLVAERNGEYAKAGLRATFRATAGSDAALADLVAGRADLALTSQQALLRARGDGTAAISVAAIVQEPLASLVSVKGDPVAPAKLRGRRVATDGSDYAAAVLDDLLQSAGVDPAAVRRVDAENLVRPLVRGRVDASLGPFWNLDVVALRRRDQRPRFLPVDRGGIPPYDEVVLAARGETVQRDGALVRRFLQAVQRGTRAARANPQVAVDAVAAAARGTFARGTLAAQVRATLPVLVPPEPGRPIGWQDYAEWQAYADWMLRQNLLTRRLDAGEALTNEFLPGEGVGASGQGPQAG